MARLDLIGTIILCLTVILIITIGAYSRYRHSPMNCMKILAIDNDGKREKPKRVEYPANVGKWIWER